MKTINQFQIRLIIVIICTILAGLLLYKSSVISLMSAVINREGSSHGLLVPFFSGYFIWSKREQIGQIKPLFDYIGIPFIFVGILFPILFNVTYRFNILSLLVLISGLIISLLGFNFFKIVAFPFLFLIAMIPLPQNIYVLLANHLREITFGISSWVIAKIGIPFYREGLLLHLPNAILKVNVGCSGIRYLVSYFIIGIAYSYLVRQTNWMRFVSVCATIPISILASVLRLSTIFLLTYYFSPKMAEYWPHIFISWSIFFIILILSISFDQYCQKKNKSLSPKRAIFCIPTT